MVHHAPKNDVGDTSQDKAKKQEMRNNLSPLARSTRRLSGLVYLLRDEFTTDESAPITSPSACEPGPGTLTITDTNNAISVSSGNLVLNSATIAANSGVLSDVTVSNTAGQAVFINVISSNTMRFGLYETNLSNIRGWTVTGGISLLNGNSIFSLSSSATGIRIQIRKNPGCYYIEGSTLIWVDNSNNTNELKIGASVSAISRGGSISYIRAAQLSAPWDTDYGIATNRVASPAVNETTTSEANALIEQTWTAVTGETWEMMTRRTDDNNCWIVRCSQGGSTIKLIEKNAGVETERSSAAQTWTNGTQYRLVVIQDGNTIRTYVANVAKNTYASATFNNTATSVKTNKAGSNLVTYPRTLSGSALTELQRWTS